MTVKAQTYVLVKVVGHIDGDFKGWADKVVARITREMELQFGSAAEVSRYGSGSYGSGSVGHVGTVDHRTLEVTDADGKPMIIGGENDYVWPGPGEVDRI